ncbi:Signal transduction histidine kinase [Pseudonocardia thermophila]|uniref:Signal transduction histidine kinase n=1 Tax=Pseudonocardia thermophila TaxID=1848 RepID=A0A1M6UM88_PSETH|nr:GAF domain-containing sensor histidine kinase [Pseudonocardia thermophila]SHK70306.1 Signal transduction histidine kinase [Pseudonocardia thermophila]
MTEVARVTPDLHALTGIRSGKPSFYPEYRHSAEGLRRVIHALDRISAALVRTHEGSEALVRAVVAAAADHLTARWVVFALVDGQMPDAHPRHLVLGPGGVEITDRDRIPEEVWSHVERIRAAEFTAADHVHGSRDQHVHVPITSGCTVVGSFAVWTGTEREIDATDESVLRILAGQTAAALQNCALYQRGEALLRRSERLREQARKQAEDLAERNSQLQAAQEELFAARQHQVLVDERHRIARELHDSVTQFVLSAGMQIELCRTELTDPALIERLDTAKELTRRAVEQLRSAIYALSDDEHGEKTLPAMLERLPDVHMPEDLRVDVRIGGNPVPLPAQAEQSLFRVAGEALFNTAVHAEATRAEVRLVYRRDRVVLTIADDGRGRPEDVRRSMRAAARAPSGEHRGMANIQARARELGGTLTLSKSRLGGLQVQVSVPLPVEDPS